MCDSYTTFISYKNIGNDFINRAISWANGTAPPTSSQHARLSSDTCDMFLKASTARRCTETTKLDRSWVFRLPSNHFKQDADQAFDVLAEGQSNVFPDTTPAALPADNDLLPSTGTAR